MTDRAAGPHRENLLPWLSLGLVVLSWTLTFGLYDRIPDPVPTHWNLRGQADDFMPKPWGALLAPGLLSVVWALLSFGPQRTTDPRSGLPLRHLSAYQTGVLAVIFAMSSLHLWMLFDGARVQPVALVAGVLLVSLGVVLPRVPRNHVMGIRTPWSMRSDSAWEATHRLAGPVMVVGGAAALACGILGARPAALATVLVLSLGVPTVASWVVARR